MSTDPFVHSERDLVAALGLSQKAVRDVRADGLEQKTDWKMVHGEVRYSDAGKARLLALLKISIDADPPAAPAEVAVGSERPGIVSRAMDVLKKFSTGAEPSAPAAAPAEAQLAAPTAAPTAREPGAREELVVHKCYRPNRRILEAKTASGQMVLVRVADNTNFQPGMIMKCRYGGGPVWELDQRPPRRPGKW